MLLVFGAFIALVRNAVSLNSSAVVIVRTTPLQLMLMLPFFDVTSSGAKEEMEAIWWNIIRSGLSGKKNIALTTSLESASCLIYAQSLTERTKIGSIIII